MFDLMRSNSMVSIVADWRWTSFFNRSTSLLWSDEHFVQLLHLMLQVRDVGLKLLEALGDLVTHGSNT
jgi:hypothetical protein